MTTILVVEDEELIAGDIQRTLVRLGYDVPVTVGTGAAAVESVAQLSPELVLMDIKLRGKMDGIEAARNIRARFGTPIVYLTSHSDEATLARAIETQPYGYLLKPFSDRELRTSIVVAIQKHELESRLEQRERWFSTTLRSISDAVIATDPSQIITFMNGEAEKLTGWGSEAVGRKIEEVFRLVDESGSHVDGPIGVALETSLSVALPPNIGLVMKTGQHIAIDDSAAPIIDDTGGILGGVVVFRDITDRRRLEQRVAQTERLASLGTMAAGVAHEINNPLAYVVANVEVAQEGLKRAMNELGGLDESPTQAKAIESVRGQFAELQEALGEAAAGAERVRLIVHDLKNFIGIGGSERYSFVLSDVLEGVIKLTSGVVRHKARLRRSFGATPLVEAQDGQLAQLLTNLLLNAAQAIAEDEPDKNEVLVTTFTNEAGQAVVEIRDTGPGIPPQVLPRIFDPFFTTKAIGSGMGLGLAICHNIVTASGGSLTAENPVGGGALFRVTLPPARSAIVPIPVSVPAPVTGRRGKVLIIDDESAIASAMERILQGQHAVTVLTDGRQALAKIANGAAYDIIFCDLMMPEISGMDVYEALARDNPGQAKRMVFMTGGSVSARATEFLESTSNTQLSKPFRLEAVRTLVSDFVRQSSSS